MPVISRFDDIVIKMYLRQKEHNSPHIHAICGECVGVFLLKNEEMIQGDLPIKSQNLVKQFIQRYRKELLHMWESQKFEMLPPV